MIELMNRLSDKMDWEKKIFNVEITAKWKAEALATPNTDMSEKMVDWVSSDYPILIHSITRVYRSSFSTLTVYFWYNDKQCIAELKHKAELLRETQCVEVLSGVFKSDTIVPEALKTHLKAAISPLENIPDREKDWHPGSEEMVLDLVHPSLYPLVYGQTRILFDGIVGLDDCMKRCGDGRVLSVPAEEQLEQGDPYWERNNAWSQKYQWLPSEFEIPPEVDDVK